MAEGVGGGFGGFGDFGDVGGDTSTSGAESDNRFDNGGFNYKTGGGLTAGKVAFYAALALGGFVALKKFKVI